MRRPTRAERRQIKNCRVFEDARLNSEDFGFRQNQIGSVDCEAVLRSRPRNDVSWHGGDPWIAPSEFELIKNRTTVVKCERQGGGADSLGGYPYPLPFGSMSPVTRSTTPNFRPQLGYLAVGPLPT